MQLPRKMSAQNVMASISRTLGNRNDSKTAAANEVKFAGEESKDKLYEPKHKQKLVRVLTVVAYVISVSLAAIILSLYYTFIWDPKDHSHYMIRQTKVNLTASRVECVNLTLSAALSESPGGNETLVNRTKTTESSRMDNIMMSSTESTQSVIPLQNDLNVLQYPEDTTWTKTTSETIISTFGTARTESEDSTENSQTIDKNR